MEHKTKVIEIPAEPNGEMIKKTVGKPLEKVTPTPWNQLPESLRKGLEAGFGADTSESQD